MRKILALTCLLGLSSLGFSQQLLTSLKDGILLNNQQATAFEEGKTYFYIVKNTDLQVYKTQGVFYVPDHYKFPDFNGNMSVRTPEGTLLFSFVPVVTQKGAAIKIDSHILNRSGLDLRGAQITVIEKEDALYISFKVQGCGRYRTPATKTFEVLIAPEEELSQAELSAMAAKQLRLALAVK